MAEITCRARVAVCLIVLIMLAVWPLSATAHDAQSSLRKSQVDVDFTTRVETAGKSEFDRRKFINIHSSMFDSGWNGQTDKVIRLVKELDVYFGRDTAAITWTLTQLPESPDVEGVANFNVLQAYGKEAIERLVSRKELLPMIDHEDIIACAQPHPFWPNTTFCVCPVLVDSERSETATTTRLSFARLSFTRCSSGSSLPD